MNFRLVFIVITIVFCLNFIKSSQEEIESSNENGTIRIDKEVYEIIKGTNTEVKISGSVSNYINNARLTILIVDQEGVTDGLNSVLQENGQFETTWYLTEKSARGDYTLTATYHGVKLGTLSFSVKDKEYSKDEILAARGISSEIKTKNDTKTEPPNKTEITSENTNPPQPIIPSETDESETKTLPELPITASNEYISMEVDKSIFELSDDKELLIKVHGNVANKGRTSIGNDGSYQRSGELTLVFTFPDGRSITQELFVNTGYYSHTLNIDYYGSQQGQYTVSGSFGSRCPNNPMILCQELSKREIGKIFFVVESNELTTKTKEEFESLHAQASKLYESQQYLNSMMLYSKILKYSPNDVDAINRKGLCLQKLGKLDEALNDYKRALKINPTFVKALQNIGNVYYEKGDLTGALNYYNKALEIEPKNTSVLYNKGLILKSLNNISDAKQVFEQVVKIVPSDVGALIALGNIASDSGDHERGLFWVDTALHYEPENVVALSNKGVILMDMGRYDEALEVYDKALAIKPDDAETLYNKGVALSRMGRNNDALSYYDKTLKINPDHSDALNNKQWILQELERINRENENSKNLTFAVMGIVVIAGTITAVFLIRRMRSKIVKTKIDIETQKSKDTPSDKNEGKWEGI